ncbi:MAG: hypothetical protein PF541_18420, partial [Prolixibacteraceae bacterium]|nr:hypothetical protein [Prolixibacteraceae bacterium]
MILKSRNIVAIYLVVLILFSTIGFNIISTFCDGCAIEHTSIAIIPLEDNLGCECCEDKVESISCCSATAEQEEKHHQTRTTLAQLKFDSHAAKSELFTIEAPVFILHFVSTLFNISSVEFELTPTIYQNSSPPLTGRMILSLI